jgi:two-component system response regulator HydG
LASSACEARRFQLKATMNSERLDHQELLELDPHAGEIRFAGQRAVLLDAVAMGVLRKYLVDHLGLPAARSLLTQFGFAHGWRMAEAIEKDYRWETPLEWQQAGLRVAALQGLFELDVGDPLSRAGATMRGSYEAEQHLLHFGPGKIPACWSIAGLVSGYLSRTLGADVFVLEDRCVAMGDESCHLLGRSREEWGEDRAEELQHFSAEHLVSSLDVSLGRVVTTLKTAEQKLKLRRRVVAEEEAVVVPLYVTAKSAPMRDLVDLACRIAKVDSTVLITGESGVGKERVARLVHEESSRAEGPFVAINCGAVTETLLESELFGHVRGSFTGATQDRAGLFDAANKGTILLDEIGEISPGMQVKLLRVLQEREIRRVGENKTRAIDVRVIASTNRDLAACVAAGTFRRDLYYRIKVVELCVPPLRERREDILPLARLLLSEAALRMKRNMAQLAPAAAEQLLAYDWPGNVRELANVMERAVALARGVRIEGEDLPDEVTQAVPQPMAVKGSVRPLDTIEQEYILAALAANDGNQAATAAQLEIGSATLYRKLKRYREEGSPPDER